MDRRRGWVIVTVSVSDRRCWRIGSQGSGEEFGFQQLAFCICNTASSTCRGQKKWSLIDRLID